MAPVTSDLIDHHKPWDYHPQLLKGIAHRIDWEKVSASLPEDHVRMFCDFVDWKLVSSNPDLSEEFLLEFHDRVSWMIAAGHRRDASEEFLKALQMLGIEWVCFDTLEDESSDWSSFLDDEEGDPDALNLSTDEPIDLGGLEGF